MKTAGWDDTKASSAGEQRQQSPLVIAGDDAPPASPFTPDDPETDELDAKLDQAIMDTFPASDPISISTPRQSKRTWHRS